MNKFTKNGNMEIINFDDFDGAIIGIQLEVGYYDIAHAAIRDMDCDVEDDIEMNANAELIIDAFTTASKLADMGYNAAKLIEDIPKILIKILSGDIEGAEKDIDCNRIK